MTAVRQFSTILFALLPFAPLAACGGASSEDPDAGDQTPASDTDSGASLEDGSAMSAPSPSPNHADGGARTDASTDAGFPSTDATAPHPPDGGSHLDSGTPPPSTPDCLRLRRLRTMPDCLRLRRLRTTPDCLRLRRLRSTRGAEASASRSPRVPEG